MCPGLTIQQHPSAAALTQADALLRSALEGDLTPDALQRLERIRNVVGAMRTAFSTADPELIPVSALDNMNSPAQSLAAEVRAYASDNADGHLINADAYADALLVYGAPVRATAMTTSAVPDVQAAVTNFRRSAGQLLHNVEDEAARARERLEQMSEAVNKLSTEIASQQTRLDNAIAQYQQQFSDAEAQRGAAFQHLSSDIRTQLEAALATTRSSTTQAIDAVGADLARIVAQGKADLDSELTSARQDVESRLARLDELHQQAVRMVTVIGNTGLTGDYQRVANEDKSAADRWRNFAIAAFAVAAVGNAIVLGFELHQHVSLTTLIGARVSISVPLLALAAYAVAESQHHRREERLNRQLELQLASIGPYLAELPADDQQTIRGRVFDRFFPGRGELASLTDGS